MAKSDLFDAIRKNSLRQMQLLLESGCDVDCRNANSETPLMVALYCLRQEQRERAVKHLLDTGADVNARSGQGRTALSYACALDQVDSVRLLLQQADIDVNLGDVSGVTPLMLSAALGHRAAVDTLLDCARAGRVRLHVQARDDSDFTAADYAAVSGNDGIADHILRDSYSSSGNKTPGTRMHNNNSSSSSSNNSSTKARNMHSSAMDGGGRHGRGPHGHTNTSTGEVGEEMQQADTRRAALGESNLPAIRQFARDVKALQARNDTNLAAIPPSSSSSRPPSRTTTTTPRSRPPSSSTTTTTIPTRADSRLSSGRRSKNRPGSRAGAHSRGSGRNADNEDEDDLDLSSLRELMGTVREAAKEIREMVEPMQKEQEKAKQTQQQQHRRSRKRSRPRRQNSNPSNHPHPHPHHQQIQAEIHAVSEINGHVVPPLPPPSPLPPSSSPPPPPHPPPPPAPAFLHVADNSGSNSEELSYTWPRQRGRSVSRERSLSGGLAVVSAGDGNGTGTLPFHLQATPRGGVGDVSGITSRSTARVSPGAARSEQEILEKVVRRQQHVGPDPLVAAINSSNTVPRSRLIMESRQRINHSLDRIIGSSSKRKKKTRGCLSNHNLHAPLLSPIHQTHDRPLPRTPPPPPLLDPDRPPGQAPTTTEDRRPREGADLTPAPQPQIPAPETADLHPADQNPSEEDEPRGRPLLLLPTTGSPRPSPPRAATDRRLVDLVDPPLTPPKPRQQPAAAAKTTPTRTTQDPLYSRERHPER
ncbi:uncharacterized protein LOC143280262 [Babylonia areolata]|uniref:uncharacterized protein LOC143280262 n=1 Tax=Babylonia areolata TaxID=304850 RepID=UPI003FD3D4C6